MREIQNSTCLLSLKIDRESQAAMTLRLRRSEDHPTDPGSGDDGGEWIEIHLQNSGDDLETHMMSAVLAAGRHVLLFNTFASDPSASSHLSCPTTSEPANAEARARLGLTLHRLSIYLSIYLSINPYIYTYISIYIYIYIYIY